MGEEFIAVASQKIEALREVLAPKLKAVLVGIDPNDVSAAGHYY